MQKEELKIRQLANGTTLTTPIFRFKGSGNAPSVYIQASMHGPEVQGNAVIYKLIEYLKEKPPIGDVTLVPVINSYGMNLKLGEYSFGRFEPTSGRNYNRYYYQLDDKDEEEIIQFAKKYKGKEFQKIKVDFKRLLISKIETKLNELQENGEFAQTLNHKAHKIAAKHDIVLDFHTASLAARHVYCPKHQLEDAKAFGISALILSPIVKTGDLEGAASYPWALLSQHLGDSTPIGCESYTVEFGSQERFNLNEAEADLRGVVNFLAKKGIVAREYTPYKKEFITCEFDNYLSLYSPFGGLVHFHQGPGDKVNKGDIYASIINFHDDKMKKELKAQQNFIIINQLDSGIVHEGHELMRVFTNFQ